MVIWYDGIQRSPVLHVAHADVAVASAAAPAPVEVERQQVAELLAAEGLLALAAERHFLDRVDRRRPGRPRRSSRGSRCPSGERARSRRLGPRRAPRRVRDGTPTTTPAWRPLASTKKTSAPGFASSRLRHVERRAVDDDAALAGPDRGELRLSGRVRPERPQHRLRQLVDHDVAGRVHRHRPFVDDERVAVLEHRHLADRDRAEHLERLGGGAERSWAPRMEGIRQRQRMRDFIMDILTPAGGGGV